MDSREKDLKSSLEMVHSNWLENVFCILLSHFGFQ